VNISIVKTWNLTYQDTYNALSEINSNFWIKQICGLVSFGLLCFYSKLLFFLLVWFCSLRKLTDGSYKPSLNNDKKRQGSHDRPTNGGRGCDRKRQMEMKPILT